ncbi:arginine--tRNA ligase [Rubritalea profundi]|uniref:Arginine--tRNA ligase n=1 Tax=Rubritalea profundi TaxID=1658618 RepID=A0A2S7U3W9_9BACT|nr:arginine--tRNA ligase [Rubritalea profundi]PQJ29719.1 arginine--tRNA ligase [Rubritalea profundi]
MNTLLEILESRLLTALSKAGIDLPVGFPVKIFAAADVRHGDYQANTAMALAKRLKMNPRELATQVVDALEVDDLADLEIAGPGFINFRIKSETWSQKVGQLINDPRLGVGSVAEPQNIVVDFSAPNVAKPMHVGHIRSTIIGDSLSRICRFLGHNVTTDNHIGDWGTQFGMVIYGWKNLIDPVAIEADPLQELLRLYRAVNLLCKEEEAIKDECRDELVKLQNGDAENFAIWEKCVEVSKVGLNKIYDRLDVSFDHWLGESYYNSELVPLVKALEAEGLARESDGALCVFSGEELPPKQDPFKEKRDGEWSDFPMIVRKGDGAFNYATTDVATVDHRLKQWNADKIWYVVDARQSLHFQQLFDVSKRRGCKAKLEHISFGTILGKDGKPLKTRDGDLPQLADVLDDAVKSARTVLEEKSGDLPVEEKDELAKMIGIGSVKFTELSHHRSSDYIFDLDKMVALQGDTAPYLQYSYVRVRAIFRKLEEEVTLDADGLQITEQGEINLARTLSKFGEVLPTVLDDLKPNILSNYLLDLAKAFHSFFEACQVLKSEGDVRKSRLVLCELTGRVLQQGLGLLGIQVPERM